jgi:hypothetical protein
MFSFSSKENAGAALPAMVARRATVSETIPFRSAEISLRLFGRPIANRRREILT